MHIDDVIVDESGVNANKVVDHLRKYGLLTKSPQPLQTAKVLGLQLQQSDVKDGNLIWSWGKLLQISSICEGKMSRRELFYFRPMNWSLPIGRLSTCFHTADS